MKNTNSSRLARTTGTLLVACTLAIAGCDTDDLLTVEDPEFVTPETLEDPELIDIVITGALGEFTVAYPGSGGESYITASALMADELISVGTFPTRTATDQRAQQSIENGNTSDGPLFNLQQARRALAEAVVSAESPEADVSDATIGRLKALQGYTYLAIAEGYCEGVPISNRNLETGEFEYGSASTTSGLLSDAATLFGEAVTLGGAFENLARIGQGRALVNAGDYQAAEAVVSSVPTEYVYFLEMSTNAANNSVWGLQDANRYGIPQVEGGNGQPFRDAGDTRVQQVLDGPSFEAGYDDLMWATLKYPERESDIPLATGIEARLIEAEAALDRGEFDVMTGILNTLRDQVDALQGAIVDGYTPTGTLVGGDDLTIPATEAEAIDQLFQERAFWLHLDGHRLGDLRRLVRDYGRAANTVYPTGAYHKGDVYGNDVVLPVTFEEANNPNYELSQCNVGQV